MQDLNFPSYTFRLKNSENNIHIFDVIRKKFVLLQPEEWVRQHCIHFLTNEKKYPISLINVEKVVHINGLNKRYDVVVYNPDGSIHLIIECKAPKVKISRLETTNEKNSLWSDAQPDENRYPSNKVSLICLK